MKKFLMALVMLALASSAHAQGSVDAESIYLGTYGGTICHTYTGSGAPSGGNVCDHYIDYATGNLYTRTGAGWLKVNTYGTVTSVGLSLPSFLTVTGSPVTTSGTLTGTLATQVKNTGLFGPTTGADTAPTFRSLVLADLPTDSANKVLISGTTASYSATPIVTSLTGTTSLATPTVYGYGTGTPLALGGSGVACATWPTCEAAAIQWDTLLMTQRLRTDTSFQTRWFMGTDGAWLTSSHAGAYAPLNVTAAPLKVFGGGLHVGETITSDPGVGNAVIDGYVGSPGYVSQVTGWRCTSDAGGQCDMQYLSVNEMHAKKFIADVEIALLGGVLVTKSQAKLSIPFMVPSKGSISVLTVKDIPDSIGSAVYESGDTVMLRQFTRASGGLSIANACGVVTSYSDNADGTQNWNFQRDLSTDGGAMTDLTVMPIDSLALDFGVSGAGYYEISAADGAHAVNAPYAQTVRWTGTSPCNSANLTVTTRIGQLKGITATSEYGAILGTYGATSAGKYIGVSDQMGVQLHNVPLSLYSGSTKTVFIDPATSSIALGDVSLGAPTGYMSSKGMWAGISATKMKWFVGDPAGQYISWDGDSTLTVNGAIVVSGTVPTAALATNSLALGGTAASVYANSDAIVTLGLDSNGNPILPHTATASGSGLFLGSDYMGYFTSSAFKTYIKSDGTFAFNGCSGTNYLCYTGGVLTLAGTLVITSGSGYANLSDKPTTLAAIDSTSSTKLSGIEAGATVTSTHTSADTSSVNGVGASTVSGGAGKANAGLDSSGNVVRPISGSNMASATGTTGLNLTSTYLGYWDGAAWKTYIDASGNFFMGGSGTILGSLALGTSGSLSSGATAFGTGTGYWLDYNSGSPRFRVGNLAADYFQWDGSNISMKSATVTINSTGISIGQAPETNKRVIIRGSSTAGTDYVIMGTSSTGVVTFSSANNGDFNVQGRTTLDGVAVIETPTDGVLLTNYTGGAGTNTQIAFYRGLGSLQGSITTTGGTAAYNTTSDIRLKTNIRPTIYGLANLLKIDVSDFAFKADPSSRDHTGFIAQQLNPIYPEAVYAPTDGMWQVDYGKLTPLLVKAVQELTARVTALEKEKR